MPGAEEQAAASDGEEHAPPTGEAFVEAVHLLDRIDRRAILIFALLVGATLLGRWMRLRHDHAKLRIAWVDGPEFTVGAGPSVLEIATMHHVPHAHLCRGRGRCGTCRVRIVDTEFPLPPPNDTERGTLSRVGAGADVRLACQLLPHGGRLRVERLVAPDIRPADMRRRHGPPAAAPAGPSAEPAE
jgi:ferredoxin